MREVAHCASVGLRRGLRHLCHGLGMRRFLVEGLVIYYVCAYVWRRGVTCTWMFRVRFQVRAREADGAGSLDKRLDQEGG